MLISVIIPTHNRARILQECLRAILAQDMPQKDFEVIVVDDGSRDDTSKTVKILCERHDNLRYFHQINLGQGIARNLGVTKATGDVVVLIGDDIIVKKDFLSEHLRFHLRNSDENVAVLGFTTWHPKLPVSAFMSWLTNGSSILGKFGGHQFAYEKLNNREEADYNFFYTSNISLKRTLLEKFPFDPTFSGYGWEDIELGYRLHKRVGLRVLYNPKAVGYHDHMMSEDSLAGRMRSIGKSARVIHHKYPELKKVPPLWKQWIFLFLASRPMLTVFGFIRNMTQGKVSAFYYYALSKKYFMEGLRSARL